MQCHCQFETKNVLRQEQFHQLDPDWPLVEVEGEQGAQTSLDVIPATLKQAREILRLARVVKAEAEQIKQEAQRELDLARTERRDAELLKRNASEILKMAKEKLHSASK